MEVSPVSDHVTKEQFRYDAFRLLSGNMRTLSRCVQVSFSFGDNVEYVQMFCCCWTCFWGRSKHGGSCGRAGEACTIVLRGATQQILDEAERSLHDALCVLAQTVKEPRTVYGGGMHARTGHGRGVRRDL